MDRKGSLVPRSRNGIMATQGRPPNALERSAGAVRSFPSHSGAARSGGLRVSPGNFDPGYHGATPYTRSEPVDIIFDSDFAKFDKTTGTYRCSVPSTFRGQRVDIVQLSSCSLDINSPNSGDMQGDGEETAETNTESKDMDDTAVDDVENGVKFLPQRVVPPTLYMQREVRYFSTSGNTISRLRPLFGGSIKVHNTESRMCYKINFPNEYIIGEIQMQDNTATVKTGKFRCLASDTNYLESHHLVEYDMKYRIAEIVGLPSGFVLADPSTVPAEFISTLGTHDPSCSPGSTVTQVETQKNTLLIRFASVPSTSDKYRVILRIKAFNGHAEVCTRINSILGEASGVEFSYSGRNGRYSVGPERVFIPDNQEKTEAGSLFGRTVCECLGIDAGQRGGPDMKTHIPPTIRMDRVILSQGAAPIAYTLQSGMHLSSEIRKVYGRMDGRMGTLAPSLTLQYMGTNALPDNKQISIGSVPFRDPHSLAKKIEYELELQTSNMGWKVTYDASAQRIQILSPDGRPFQVIQSVRSTSGIVPSTPHATFMIGAHVNPLLPIGLLPFGSSAFRGLPLRNAPDPRLGIMHLYQEHAELRESTVAVVTEKVPIQVTKATDYYGINTNQWVEIETDLTSSGSSHAFSRGDVVEAFDQDGKLIRTRFIVAQDAVEKIYLYPMDRTQFTELKAVGAGSSNDISSKIKYIRHQVMDDPNRYSDCLTSTGTNIFINESDMGRPGPSPEDTPQPILSFSSRSLGAAIPIGIQVALNRSPNMTRHSCSPDVETVYVRLCHSNVCTNKVPSLPNDLGRASGILGRITNSAGLKMDRSLSGSASFPGGTRLPPELEFQFLDQAGQVIRSGLKKWSLSLTIPNVTLNLDRA